METQNELVKINPSEFGLTDETAKNIQSQFEPMQNKKDKKRKIEN